VKKIYPFIILSLLISLFIYLFYRTDKTVVNEIVIRVFSLNTYAAWKANVNQVLPLHEWVIYSLPEGLWVFCITLTSRPYYFKLDNWRIDCLYIPLVFCISLEVFQLLHVTNGRFDFTDIWISFIFWLIAHYGFDDQCEKRDIFTPLNSKAMVCLVSYSIVYLSHVSM